MVLYFATMLIASAIGLLLVTAVRPGRWIGESQRRQAEASYRAQGEQIEAVQRHAAGGILGAVNHLVTQMVPENVFAAAMRGQPLPVIFFSLFFGVVVALVGERAEPIKQLFDAAFEVLMRMVEVVLWLAPIGVFALMTKSIAQIGLESFAQSIGMYMVTVTIGLALHGLVVLPLVCWLFARANPFRLIMQMRQALVTAMATDSSSATLPVTIECATRHAGIDRRVAGFVLPLGATMNMDGTALYEAVAVVFLAQAYAVPLTPVELVLVAITATLAAVGAAGIPSAGLVTMVIVIQAVNGSVLSASPEQQIIPVAAWWQR
jgi:Na+/H+-dicarboxylate symporter